MIRRRSPRNQRPALLSTMGRTAVIAGTATAVSQGVRNRSEQRATQQTSFEPAVPAPERPSVQEQLEAAQSREVTKQTGPDLIGQLQQRAEMRAAGLLTDVEFDQGKARILAE